MAKNSQRLAVAGDHSPPSNWTTIRPHKYCGKMDAGSSKKSKANHTHHCEACTILKMQLERDDNKAKSARRQEKMSWASGGNDD